MSRPLFSIPKIAVSYFRIFWDENPLRFSWHYRLCLQKLLCDHSSHTHNGIQCPSLTEGLWGSKVLRSPICQVSHPSVLALHQGLWPTVANCGGFRPVPRSPGFPGRALGGPIYALFNVMNGQNHARLQALFPTPHCSQWTVYNKHIL